MNIFYKESIESLYIYFFSGGGIRVSVFFKIIQIKKTQKLFFFGGEGGGGGGGVGG